jgi:hypothetical protein
MSTVASIGKFGSVSVGATVALGELVGFAVESAALGVEPVPVELDEVTPDDDDAPCVLGGFFFGAPCAKTRMVPMSTTAAVTYATNAERSTVSVRVRGFEWLIGTSQARSELSDATRVWAVGNASRAHTRKPS